MNDINGLAEWFNNLEYKKQLNIYNYINDYDELKLNSEDENFFDELINKINEIVLDQTIENSNFIQILIEAGFEKFFANTLINYSKLCTEIFNDSIVIKELTPQQLDSVVKFIINNMAIYKNYEEISYEIFVETCGFKDNDSAGKTIRFINNMIYKVCNHELSPEILRNKLIEEYKIPEQLSDIIIENIKDKLFELEKAHFLEKINMIFKKVSNL